MNTYFGQQQGLTHQQLAEAARAMNLPTNRETLRRVMRANSILCRGLVKTTSLDCLFKVKSQSHKDKRGLGIFPAQPKFNGIARFPKQPLG